MSLLRKIEISKVEKNRLNSRMAWHRKMGVFHSRKVAYSKTSGCSEIKRLLPIVTAECWSDSEDILKAPHCNSARPHYFSKAPTNQYYGWNIPIAPEGHDAASEFVLRTAYGVGSGATSIGLDPRNAKILEPSNNLVLLTNAVTKAVAASSDRWAEMLRENPFNNVALKWYMAYLRESGKEERKQLGMHVDVTHNPRTLKPCSNNSQKPGTLTAMLTFGADKHLWFRRHVSSNQFNESTLLHFLQTSGTLIVLDPKDEQPDGDGRHWRHGSTMATTDGITVTYTFRCVQCSVLVHEDGTLVSPPISNKRRKLFEDGEKHFGTDYYKSELEKLQSRMSEFLDNNNTI